MNHLAYMPVLKWRQGEYQALLRLGDHQKDSIVPLIEVTPPDFDFELWQPKKTIDEHLEKFPARLNQKWGTRSALLDMSLLEPEIRMIGGIHPLHWLLGQVRVYGARVVPVTGFENDRDYQVAVRNANMIDRHGAGLRCSLEEAADQHFAANVESLLDQLDLEIDELDLILDLKSPNFQPISGLAQLLATVLANSPAFENARTVTIVATSFPASMTEVIGPLQVRNREEWLLYKELISRLAPNQRRPAFGDYGITSHDLPNGDMRLLKPSATVRYTVDDAWLVAKGSNVRDNGFEQYRACCGSITGANGYLGPGFSPGSEYIELCHAGAVSTGNLSTWRWVGTNHHVAKVVHDLANFYGS